MTIHPAERKPMSDTDDAPDFAAFLLTLSKGRTHRELSEALRTLTAAVNDTGKPGKLTLTIAIKPQGNDTGAVTVTDAITVKAPAYDRSATIFFVDDESNLVRDDPHQGALFAKESSK